MNPDKIDWEALLAWAESLTCTLAEDKSNDWSEEIQEFERITGGF